MLDRRNPPYDHVGLITNHPTGDAFGRLRVSSPYTIWESKLLDGTGDRLWSTELGVYGTATKNNAKSQYELTVSASGDYAIRQTLQKFNYQAGKSQLMLMTGKMHTASGTTMAMGMCDVNHASTTSPYEIYNGLYFALDNGGHRWNNGLNVVVTNNGVDNAVVQSKWNLDKMNGKGPSNKTLDITKVQIFVIDFEWLGVGRVRFGFNIDGVTYYVHEFLHANVTESVYTKSPNLPLRYEIRSYGGSGQLNQICSSVMSEGGREPSGFNHIGTTQAFSLPSNGTFTTAVDHTAFAAMRHQSDKPFSFVELISQAIITLGANAGKWSIGLVPPTTIINISGSTPTAIDDLTFTALPDSTLEFYQFNTNGSDEVADVDIRNYIIEEGYFSEATASNQGTSSLSSQNNIISLGEEIDGGRWCFLFTVQSYGTNDMRASLKFREVV